MAYKFAFLALLALQTYTVVNGKAACVCPLLYSQVCGSDGSTYVNPCSVECHNNQTGDAVRVVHNGPCELGPNPTQTGPNPTQTGPNQDPTCICTDDYYPVCGTDGETYPNRCTLRCRRPNVALKHDGECLRVQVQTPAPCVCPSQYNEVCGSNGLTYNNKCLFDCAASLEPSLRVQHRGRCQARPATPVAPKRHPCACSRNMNPVCGSDGQTYQNRCLLDCDNYETGLSVTVVYPGPCGARRRY